MTSIEAKLKKLPYEVLVALVADLYERYEDIEEIIDSCLECMRLENESADMDENLPATGLAQQIDRLTSTSHFYNFHEVYLLGEQCENVLQDIADLAEQDTEQALGLLDVLLSRHGQLHECVDDSHGVVGEAMQQAVQLWLQVAAQLRKQQPDARQWVEAVLKYNSQNDYGCFDELTGQAVPHFGRVAMVLQLLPKAFTHTATIHDFTKQKSSTITAGFASAQPDRHRWVAGWFPGRYCFTHGERPSLVRFLAEHIDYKG